MYDEERCRERVCEMLKVKLSAIDIMITLIGEFQDLTYDKIKKIVFEEVQKNVKKDN